MADKPAAPKPSDPKTDLLWFLGIAGILFVLWINNGGYQSSDSNKVIVDSPIDSNVSEKHVQFGGSNNTISSSTVTPGQVSPNTTSSPDSIWKGKVFLQIGNSYYEQDPKKEYLIIQAGQSRDEGIDITGWALVNDNSILAGNVGSQDYTISAGAGIIPMGAKIVSNTGVNNQQPIVLYGGQRSYVFSGQSPNQYPMLFNSSFQENKCLSYLGSGFDPYLTSASCPAPYNESGISNLDSSCRDFINSIKYCTVPNLNDLSSSHLSQQCRQFISDHYSYTGCVANHKNDSDFFGSSWRIYLNKSRELWNNNRETATLLDNYGKIVDKISWPQ